MRIIAGFLKGRQLELPPGSEARPTGDRAREALFNILQPRLPGARVLDLFAGSGALGTEAISRGAETCTFVELDRANANALRNSLRRFGLTEENAEVICGDFRETALRLYREKKRYSLILLDPPYRAGFYSEALRLSAMLLAPEGIVIAEHERGEEPPEAPEGLILKDRRTYGKNQMSFFEAGEETK